MTNTQRRYASRNNRPNKPNRTNTILNALIGVVILLIVITAGIIFLGNDEPEKANESDKNQSEVKGGEDKPGATGVPEAGSETDDSEVGTEEIETPEEDTEAKEEDSEESTTTEDSATGGTVKSTPSDDPLVSESIVNTAWKPVGTSQTGEHVSVYSEGHVDWNEKVKALAYTTGLAENDMIIWRIENGGGPQKSIGIVSSGNKEEKYRVYLQWVDGQGWKPEKMETLKTLDGAY